MMNKILVKILLALTLVLLVSCRKEDAPRVPVPVETETEIQLRTGYWAYYNIKESSTVGYGIIGDSIDDAEWFARLDWDIAFSENGIRTNSGTSGRGKGGIRIQPTVPDSLNLSEYEEYRYQFSDFSIDTEGIYTEILIDR